MQRYYSQSTGSSYLKAIHGSAMPPDAMPIDEDRYRAVIADPAPGKVRAHDAEGLPILVDPVPVLLSADELCDRIDAAARSLDALDALRALEYSIAAPEAQLFKASGYPSNDVPRAVAAYAINGRSPQEAADAILQAAAESADLVYQIRESRLAAKESVRALVAAGEHDQAEAVAAGAVELIRGLVAGGGGEALEEVPE